MGRGKFQPDAIFLPKVFFQGMATAVDNRKEPLALVVRIPIIGGVQPNIILGIKGKDRPIPGRGNVFHHPSAGYLGLTQRPFNA